LAVILQNDMPFYWQNTISEFIHCKFIITHIASKFLISRITR